MLMRDKGTIDEVANDRQERSKMELSMPRPNETACESRPCQACEDLVTTILWTERYRTGADHMFFMSSLSVDIYLTPVPCLCQSHMRVHP